MNMDAYSRSEKESHLDTIHYEIAMLNFCGQQLDALSPETQKAHFNTFLECFLIHYRNLIEFFCGDHHKWAKKPGDTSDLSTADPAAWAGRDLSAAELAELRAPAKEINQRHFREISQYLQHCTERRFSEDKFWNYRTMYVELRPIIEAFLKIFPARAIAKQKPTALGTGNSTATVQISAWSF